MFMLTAKSQTIHNNALLLILLIITYNFKKNWLPGVDSSIYPYCRLVATPTSAYLQHLGHNNH